MYKLNLSHRMPRVYSNYKYQRIIYHSSRGHRPYTVAKLLAQEGLPASRNGIGKFIRKYRQTGTIRVLPGAGRPSIITPEMKAIVDEQMEKDDETTATQLHALLREKGFQLSLRTVLRCRRELGWTFRGSKYCQLVREVNRVKRLEWAKRVSEKKDTYDDVIWTDESSVQLETHKRFCFRKEGCQPRLKPKYVEYAYTFVNTCLHVNT